MNIRIVGYLVVLLSAVAVAGCAKQARSVSTSDPAPTGATEPSPTTKPLEEAKAAKAEESAQPVEIPNPANVAARPEAKEFTPTPKLRDIHFDFDAYAIRAEDSQVLDADIDWMQSNPKYLILIEGHCDERGTNEYNLILGDHRAKATMNYLMAHGVNAERITTISYGEERPLCTERTEACWTLNRRAHFLVKLAQ